MQIAVRYVDVSYSYSDGSGQPRPALSGVTFEVEEGTRLGVLGPNGGGKSTLLKLTLGLIKRFSGRVEIFGLSPAKARAAKLIGYVPQRNEAELNFPLSVRDVVEMGVLTGRMPWKGLRSKEREQISEALELVGASAFRDSPIGALSGGQLQRVMIARAIAGQPRLLLLDEPTVGIDVAGQQQFAEMLTTLHKALNLTMIIVSHDIRTVAAGCDRIACLSRTLHSHVSPEGLTPGVLAEVFRHDVAAIFGDLHIDAHAADQCNHPHHAQPLAQVGLTTSVKPNNKSTQGRL